MRVVGISTFDVVGGAARAAIRIHQGLRRIGVESKLLVQQKFGDDADVLAPTTRSGKIWARLRPHLELAPLMLYRRRTNSPFTTGWTRHKIESEIERLSPDIVHLHWVGAGYVSVGDFQRIQYPMLWTLHDSWAFTGGCHIPLECEKYKKRCGRCPHLGSSMEYDLSRYNWLRKRRAWRNIKPVLVTPSRWMAERAASSSLFAESRIEIIPNGVDLVRFKPTDQRTARDILGLPRDKKLILFGVGGDISDPNKNMRLLKQVFISLRQMQRLEGIELVVVGSGRPDALGDTGVAIRHLGHFQDEISLSLVYSSADVVVVPSRQENLPNMVMEAAACARPVVAFRVGGMTDLIEDRVSGYLATPYDPADFAAGIAWTLETSQRAPGMGLEARRKTEAEFDIRRVAAKYLSLYQELVGRISAPINS